MQITVAVILYARFTESEVCNPENLRQLKLYLEFHNIGYVIYDNNHLPVKNAIREIQVFLPEYYGENDAMQIGEQMERLTEEFDIPDFMQIPKPKADAEAIKQPEPRKNRRELLREIKQRNNQETPLDFFR